MDDNKNEMDTPKLEKQNETTVCEKPQENKKSDYKKDFTYIW